MIDAKTIEELRALATVVYRMEGELAEAREDVRSLCRFILNEWGPDGALKAATFALEQRQSAKGGDANAAPDRDTNSKSATSPGVTAGASAGEDGELCKRVDDTLQAMASQASVPMGLWDKHSNGVLALIARIRSLSAQLAEARNMLDIEKQAAQQHILERLNQRDRATASQSEIDALRERIGVLEKALEPFAEAATKGEIGGYPPNYFVGATEFENARRARSALEGRDNG